MNKNCWAIGSLLLTQGCADNEEAPSAKGNPRPPPLFVERSAKFGIMFQHDSGANGKYYLPESLGAGCGLFDADGDGDLDALFVRGHDLDKPATANSRNSFFRNDGSGQFTEETLSSGFDGLAYSYGVTCGDVDADGDLDVYITNLGEDTLYYNDGKGHFTQASKNAIAAKNDFSVSSCFLDYDRDGDLDLFVTRYMDWSIDIEVDCFNVSGNRDYCSPQRYARPITDRLLRNDGVGQFTDVSTESGISSVTGTGLAVGSADLTGDGWPDIYVANDNTENALWINNQDGTFTESAGLLGCATGLDGTSRASMSVAFCDLDKDGDFEIHVSNIEGQADGLFENQNGRFLDRASGWGIAGASRRRTRWASRFLDINADGHEELIVACGKVGRGPNPERLDSPYAEANMAFVQKSPGRFSQLENFFDPEVPVEASHGTAHGDVNGDGRIDLIMVSRDGPAQLWLGNTEIKETQTTRIDIRTATGSPAIGANVLVTYQSGSKQKYPVDVCMGYASTSSHVIHTSGPVAEVKILWTNGSESVHTGPWAKGEYITVAPERNQQVPTSTKRE